MAEINEADLRILRLNEDTNEFEPPGASDVGTGAPTGVLGDYGVQMEFNTAWAEVDTLGTFAVGVPEGETVIEPPPEQPVTGVCGAGAAPCGVVGMINWFGMISGLFLMRTRFRRRL